MEGNRRRNRVCLSASAHRLNGHESPDLVTLGLPSSTRFSVASVLGASVKSICESVRFKHAKSRRR